jgi:glycosyltransferase involved in cell wall biosynthesis
MDSFDKNLFTKNILSHSKNSMMFFYDFHSMHLEYKPEHVKWFPKTIKFPWLKNPTIFKLLFPILWVIFFGIFLLLSIIICVVYRPKVCLTENAWAGAVFGVARKIGLCNTFIYCTGDWLANQTGKGFLSRLANNYIFVFMDYIAITTCDLADSYSKLCNEARERHWGRKIAKNIHHRYPPPIQIYPSTISSKRNNICFLGQVREDSGLDLILPLLPELHRDIGAKLKIIGPLTVERARIEQIIINQGLDHFVELYGFLSLDELEVVMKDCFCGINLVTTEKSYSSFAVPGKFIQYLQMKIPILATQNNGIVDVIKENNLGVIIEPSASLILSSLLNLYKDQKKYTLRILKYAEKYPYLSIKDYLMMVKTRN